MTHTPEDLCKESLFEQLFIKLAPDLRSFLLYKFQDVERADDIVQEAFVILWNNCKKVMPESARAFLYKVAQNQFLKLLKKDKVKERYLYLEVNTHQVEDPGFTFEHQELSTRLAKAIEQLPDGQREVFLLNRMDGKTYKEIAELLEVSQKAVEKRMHKALVSLRKICQRI